MSIKGTLITLVCFLVLFGIYKWDKGKRETEEKTKEAAAKLTQLSADDVDYLLLMNKDESIELKKSGTKEEPVWEILKPVKTKADANQVKTIVQSMTDAKKQEPFTLSGDQKLADYGLENPEVAAEIKSESKGQFVKVSFGDRKTGMGDYFAATEDAKDQIFLISSYVQTSAAKSLFDLRDKTVLAAPADEVTTMTLTLGPDQKLVAEKKENKWRLKSPIEDAGDETAIGDLLRKVDGAKAADFIDTTGTLQLATYGLETPSITLSVWNSKSKKEQTLLVGDKVPEEEQYYTKSSAADQIFTIPADVQQQLVKPVEDYRSKELFATVGSEADALDVASENHTYSLKRDKENKWSFTDEAEKKLDQAKVNDLLAAFVDLRVKEFRTDDSATTDTAVYGFDDPTMTVTLHSPDGKCTDKVVFGNIDTDERVIYAKREGTPSILVLEWKAPDQLLKKREDLIERKVASFQPEDAAAIEVQTAEGGTKTYRFEKKDDAWKGGVEGEEPGSIPQLEAQSFLNALTDLRYEKLHEAGSEEIEATTAPADAETTMTLKSADGKELLRVGVTGVQVDQRFLKRADGSSYAVNDTDYQRVRDALKSLLDAAPKEE